MRKVAYWSSLLLLFVIPWEDSISVINMGSLAKIMGVVVAGFWLAVILLEGKFRKPHLFHVLVLFFFLWNCVSIFWSLDTKSTVQRLITYSQIFLLMLIYWEMFQKPEGLRAGLQAYVFGGYALIVSTIYNFVIGNVAIQYEGRYSATGVNAVDLALLLMIGLPLAMQLFFTVGNSKWEKLLRAINLLYVPLSIFAIILTGSRTSLIAMIPFILFLVGARQIRTNQKIAFFIILVISFLIFLPFVPDSILKRLGTIGSSVGTGDLGGRINLWRQAIAELARHPILGVGGGAIASSIGSAVHNTFISVVAETGFVGLLLFLSILGTVVYGALRLPKGSSAFWLTVFMTWAIGALSLTWEFKKLTWIFLNFVIIAGGCLDQSRVQSPGIPVDRKSSRSPEMEDATVTFTVI